MEQTVLYFETPGPDHTEATLAASNRRGGELGIRQVVVATTTGKTAFMAAKAMPDCAIIGVTLSAGHWGTYAPPDQGITAEAESLGVRILTCPHSLMGALDSAIADKFGGLPDNHLISHVYYTWCQGTKVAVECMLMAADAGMLDMDEEVISIAGSEEGADTSLVMRPTYTSKFFDLRILELVAKPR
ncbi:MAG TPA: pyruvate kinase alpha/beta domain-containing protein [Armatimonadota bacterium]|nr:pyruvate kinase alpha/beta domain-containing protein [Armatimonadota bacterium]